MYLKQIIVKAHTFIINKNRLYHALKLIVSRPLIALISKRIKIASYVSNFSSSVIFLYIALLIWIIVVIIGRVHHCDNRDWFPLNYECDNDYSNCTKVYSLDRVHQNIVNASARKTERSKPCRSYHSSLHW